MFLQHHKLNQGKHLHHLRRSAPLKNGASRMFCPRVSGGELAWYGQSCPGNTGLLQNKGPVHPGKVLPAIPLQFGGQRKSATSTADGIWRTL
jgi:hypothetical protein